MGSNSHVTWFLFQAISVVEQEKLDNLMIEMDGTENKCTIIYIAYVHLGVSQFHGLKLLLQ